jgi:hypothetical protein
MNNQTSSKPRRRGAPLGNLNAVTHGFYSARFNKTDRTALAESNFTGLAEEIALLRLFIRRVVYESSNLKDFDRLLDTLRVICLASASLSHLVKTHAFLSNSKESEFSQALQQALDDIWKDAEYPQGSTIPIWKWPDEEASPDPSTSLPLAVASSSEN